MMKVDMEPLSDEPFHCAATLRMLPGLTLASIATTPNRLMRTRRLVADGNDDLILVIPTSGAVTISAHGREVALGRGDATFFSSAETNLSVIDAPSRFLSVALPVTTLAALAPDFREAQSVLIPESRESIRLLIGYLEALGGDMALSSPEMRRQAVTHIHDLIAVAIGESREAAEITSGRGIRAARLRAIKSDVAENFIRPDFSVHTVAARRRLSPRYIRKLLEGEGTTFSEFVLAQRLMQAHRMLGDTRHATSTVSQIAFGVGFNDLSYFNRAFRRRYGATPSEIRRAAHAGSAGASQ
jgi:AraC-like DNA-binding protein